MNSNLMSIYGILKEKSMQDIEQEFQGQNYGTFKSAVAEAIIDRLEPIQKKHKELLANPVEIQKIYEAGDIKAREKTNQLLQEVYKKVGLV